MNFYQKISKNFNLIYRNNKVSLLNKTKFENSNLKDEINSLRKKYESLEKFFQNMNTKSGKRLTYEDLVTQMNDKEQSLSLYMKTLNDCYTVINRFVELNKHGEFSYLFENLESLVVGKTFDEKFVIYFEKFRKFMEVKKIEKFFCDLFFFIYLQLN